MRDGGLGEGRLRELTDSLREKEPTPEGQFLTCFGPLTREVKRHVDGL